MNPCSGCHAGCCRSFAVPVTGADILRIERDAGLPFEDFACRWADPEGSVSRGSTPHFYFDDEPQVPFVICLRHEASETHRGTTKCQFLCESSPSANEPLGTARCSIYAFRPAACRTFPTKLNTTGELTILYDVSSHERRDEHPVYSLCPRPWQACDIDPLSAPQELAVAKFEGEFFQAVANLWNQTPRPFVAFPEFLRLVYRNRVLAGPAAAEATSETPPLPRLRAAA